MIYSGTLALFGFSDTQMKIKLEKNTLHFLALLLGTVALSLAPIFVRYSDTSSSSIAFWRMFIASPLLAMVWLVLPVQQERLVSTNKDKIRNYIFLVLAGVSFALDLLTWNISVALTTVANATLFVNFASLFVAFLSWQILKIVPTRNLTIGMLLAIGGSVLLVWPHLSNDSSSLMGDALGLVAAFFYGLYLLLVQIIRPAFSTMAIMTLTAIITAVTAFLATLILNQSLDVGSGAGWAALFGQAIVVQMIGQSLIAYALLSLPATMSAVILLLQPVLSACIAAWLFNETLDGIQSLGMLFVLAGIIYAKLTTTTKAAALKVEESTDV